MKELYFHIGQTKTGSSALQKFLVTNREILRKKGILYPKVRYEMGSEHFLGFSGNVSDYDFNLLSKDVETFGSEELRCIEKLKNMFNDSDVVLFSAEHVDMRDWIKPLFVLSAFLVPEKVTIKIIVYLRRQDEHVESMWNQYVKCAVCLCENCWEFSQKEVVTSKYDYNGILSDISQIVGRENIICKLYDTKKYSAENTIYAEFMSILGIDDISDFELPRFQVNPSLSRNMVEVRRIFNSIQGAKTLFPVVGDIRGNGGGYIKSEEKAAKHSSLLTYEQRKYILDYYNESNISLGREYFGIDGSPFAPLEKAEEDGEARNDNSIYADVIAFLGEILVRQEEKFASEIENLHYAIDEFELSKEIVDGSRIIVYGGKRKGRVVYNWIRRKEKYQALCIADQRADELQSFGLPICKPQEIFKMQYDYILISVDTQKTEDSIQQYLEENGVEKEKIIRAI